MGGCVSREEVLKTAPSESAYYCDHSSASKWYVMAPAAIAPPRIAPAGPASMPARTIIDALRMAVSRQAGSPIFRIERPCPPLIEKVASPPLPIKEWMCWTLEQAMHDIEAIAKALLTVGFKQFDSLNVWGFNAPEWIICIYAAAFAGGKIAGLYPSDTPAMAAYKVLHSDGAAVIVDELNKVVKLQTGLEDMISECGPASNLKCAVAWAHTPEEGATIKIPGIQPVPFYAWDQFLAIGRESGLDGDMNAMCNRVQPGHCAGLIYTSGTTGQPKAVMVSHDSLMYISSTVMKTLSDSTGLGVTDESAGRIVSYLPLSHVAGMMVDAIIPPLTAGIAKGHTTIFFARSYDLKVGAIKDRLVSAKPTMFLGVPLVWEKIADKIRALGATTTGLKKSIATWAKKRGVQHARNMQLGGSGAYPCAYNVADKLVLKNVKAALGLDQCVFGFTGAAPIRFDTLEFFGALGIHINEVYGMSECCGACTWSLDECHEWGSCGWELPGIEVRCFKVNENDINKKELCPNAPSLTELDEKYQGELCYRGRSIMMGYLANRSFGSAHMEQIDKANRTTIDSEGWLHSGDKGLITSFGMVKITGRYKELIIGAGGENIAPVPIEDFIKTRCDGIAEVMMVGDKRKYNVAIITLKAVGANGESPGTEILDAGAKRVNPEVQTISAAMSDPLWLETVQKAIEAANNNSKICVNPSFKIQKFTILPHNFSEQEGELTPTKKMKRKVIEEQYATHLDEMYGSGEMYVKFIGARRETRL
eukprot:NODE_1014_length_2650_cov_39.990091.p1 GENE.NODE_1014_length_2650_cov_39.990091~~NODE_1014_length_2650_cov_39.990091.p1  ORF type:complete len:762 (-),score=132.11 NODE_1014_length_2650_cov_39.990091:244-2529(-)